MPFMATIIVQIDAICMETTRKTFRLLAVMQPATKEKCKKNSAQY